MLPMGTLPRAGAMAVPRREKTAKGAPQRLDRTVMMKTDGSPLVRRKLVTKFRKNVDATTTMTTSITPSRLAKVMKECHDRNAICIEPTLMGKHIVVHLHRVCRKSAILLMMAIAPTLEIGRTVQVSQDLVRPRTSQPLDRIDDPLFRFSNLTHTPNNT